MLSDRPRGTFKQYCIIIKPLSLVRGRRIPYSGVDPSIDQRKASVLAILRFRVEEDFCSTFRRPIAGSSRSSSSDQSRLFEQTGSPKPVF